MISKFKKNILNKSRHIPNLNVMIIKLNELAFSSNKFSSQWRPLNIGSCIPPNLKIF